MEYISNSFYWPEMFRSLQELMDNDVTFCTLRQDKRHEL
jgi:hypothetical protein